MMGGASPVAAMCAAHVLTMLGTFAFPALLPTFIADWRLSNTEAGWIAGIYFGAYALAVPALVTLTDRLDARWVYVGGALAAAAAAGGFALLADGFWSAATLRALAGVALAATYMPGLKVLVDRYRGPRPTRAVALYTASFSLGTALSFLIAGEIAAAWGWRWVFAASAVAALVAAAIALVLGPVARKAPAARARLFDFRAVFTNHPAMGYVLGYGVHCWELFTLRAWLVAMLAFAVSRDEGSAGGWPAPTTIAMLSGLVAMAASVAGNELCVRYGRRRVIRLVMAGSAASALGLGFAVALPYPLVVALALVYSAAVQLDSAALTAGAVAAASRDRQGATMAVHSLIGFGGGFLGPLVFGWTLDLAGGSGALLSWGLAFAIVAALGALGPLVLASVPGNQR